MKPEALTVYCVESERGETLARFLKQTEALQFATDQQRLRGRSPVDRLHVVPREFVLRQKPAMTSV